MSGTKSFKVDWEFGLRPTNESQETLWCCICFVFCPCTKTWNMQISSGIRRDDSAIGNRKAVRAVQSGFKVSIVNSTEIPCSVQLKNAMDKGICAVDKSLSAWSHSAITQRQRQQTAKIWKLPKWLQQCQNMWRDKVGNGLLHSIVSADCFPCQKCKSWATLKDVCSSTVDTLESFRIVYPGFRFVGFIQVRVDLLSSMGFILCKLDLHEGNVKELREWLGYTTYF